VKYDIISRPIK